MMTATVNVDEANWAVNLLDSTMEVLCWALRFLDGAVNPLDSMMKVLCWALRVLNGPVKAVDWTVRVMG